MTDQEQLDEARAKEAGGDPVKAARLARENWTPPEPVVDPDELAFREWAARRWPGATLSAAVADAYYAGARMAREREQERAKVLEAFVKSRAVLTLAAAEALAKYRGEA